MTAATQRSGAEFVALIALTFSLIAMSIDSMLPALGQIASDLNAADPNDRQLVLTAFFGGMTLGQIFYGPLSDSTGRKPAMYTGIAFFILGGLICAFTTSFTVMVMARVLQGFGAAGPRIVAMAMVRDLHSGRAMARIMSFVMAVFILVPMLAPSIGQLILLVADWRAIFFGLVVIGIIDFLWLWLRQPESLPSDRRAALSIGNILRAVREAVSNRITLAYTIATGCVFGAFISYLGTSQQIFQEQYGTGKLFSVYFGILAMGIGIASLTNARLVMRFGMRNLSKWALRAAAVLTVAFIPVALLFDGHPPLWLFVAVMTVLFFFNGLLFGNYNAIAMEPMGHIAGVASAVIGSLSTLIAVSVGTPIGRFYDGTVIPLIGGFALMAIIAIIATEWAESRRRPPAPITPS